MYRPTSSPSARSLPPPPPPPPADGAGADAPSTGAPPSPRYVYLVTRLRTRKITMEEATELFGLMNTLLRDARARSEAVPTQPEPALPTPAPTSRSGSTLWNDDNLGFALLFLGAGAGLLAAGAKKIRDHPQTSDAPPRSH